jgi:glycerophosphoryl diester phosphodiesterase
MPHRQNRSRPARAPAQRRPCLRIAHRGDSSRCPENTLAAFAAAADAGADGVELDVRLSADGMVVVCHDAHLSRFGGSRRPLSRRTLADLRQGSIGAWFHPRFTAERIPTLSEVLARFPDLRILIELKAASGPGRARANRRLIAAVAAVIARAHASRRVLLLCFDASVLELVRRLDPRLRRVRNCEHGVASPSRWLEQQPGLFGVCVDQRVLSSALVATAHMRGIAVFAYTCNDAAVLARLRALHIDGLLSDRPAWLVARVRP